MNTASELEELKGRQMARSNMLAKKEAKEKRKPIFDLGLGKCPRKGLCEWGFDVAPCAEQVNDNLAANDPLSFNLDNALSFTLPDLSGQPLGPADVVAFLNQRTDTNVSLNWVKNHWSLILWKLSSYIRLKPDERHIWWTAEEVLRQFSYRWEREFQAHRSIIRRIQERDCCPSVRMVLCVSRFLMSKKNGAEVKEMELTDGWYFMRATVDDSLRRAISKKKLQVGHKLEIFGAKTLGPREGIDVLDAYDMSSLEISGNSSTLAKWDARLGRKAATPILTLRSLTQDGGFIPILDVQIFRLLPLTYSDGKNAWDEQQEAKLQDEWQALRDSTAQKLTQDFGEDLRAFEMILDEVTETLKSSLEAVSLEASGRDLFDDLEEASSPALRRKLLSTASSSVLQATYEVVRERVLSEQQTLKGRVEKELEVCVRSFLHLKLHSVSMSRNPVLPGDHCYAVILL
ncbi:hypothetical protein BT69DRAFT_349329 [Atractiella rhizophila]|nr:hypothetical protein BT69DRAFT_349329 [Atractiella rhizophila]